jgi:hypothetical protein
MESLIQVFRMDELPIDTRIKIIKRLGIAIEWQLSMDLSPLIYELVIALDSDNEIKNDYKYTRHLNDK